LETDVEENIGVVYHNCRIFDQLDVAGATIYIYVKHRKCNLVFIPYYNITRNFSSGKKRNNTYCGVWA
jgi:hypothetical protein